MEAPSFFENFTGRRTLLLLGGLYRIRARAAALTRQFRRRRQNRVHDLRVPLAGVLVDNGALQGASDHGTTKSLYAADPQARVPGGRRA